MPPTDDSTRLRLAHAGRNPDPTTDSRPACPSLVGRVLTADPIPRGTFFLVQPIVLSGAASEGAALT